MYICIYVYMYVAETFRVHLAISFILKYCPQNERPEPELAIVDPGPDIDIHTILDPSHSRPLHAGLQGVSCIHQGSESVPG